MTTDESTSLTAVRRQELQPVIEQVTAILQALQSLAQTFGPALEQLATVNWRELGRQGYLAGTPRLVIERTIEDARAVLTSGQRVLTEVLQQAQDPAALANPELDIPGNVRAAMRLYVDTPEDIRNRCRRLTAWLQTIARAQQQAGAELLSSQVGWPA